MSSLRKDVTEKDKLLYTMWKNNRDFRDRLNRYQMSDDDIISKSPEPTEDEDVVFVSEMDYLKRRTAGVALVPELLRKPRKSTKIQLKPIIRPRKKKADEPAEQGNPRFFVDADGVTQKQIEPLVARSTEADCNAKKNLAAAVCSPRPTLGVPLNPRLFFPTPPPPLPASLMAGNVALTTSPEKLDTAHLSSLRFNSTLYDANTNPHGRSPITPLNVVQPMIASRVPPVLLAPAPSEPSSSSYSEALTKSVVGSESAPTSKNESNVDNKATPSDVKKKLKKALRPDLSNARPSSSAKSNELTGQSTASDSMENMQWDVVDVVRLSQINTIGKPQTKTVKPQSDIATFNDSGGDSSKREFNKPKVASAEPKSTLATPAVPPKLETREAVTPSVAARSTTAADVVVPLRNPKNEPITCPVLTISSRSSVIGVNGKSAVDALILKTQTKMKKEVASSQQQQSPIDEPSSSSAAGIKSSFIQLHASSKSAAAADVKRETLEQKAAVSVATASSPSGASRSPSGGASPLCAATASQSIRQLNNLLRSAGSLLDEHPSDLPAAVSAHINETIESVFRTVTGNVRTSSNVQSNKTTAVTTSPPLRPPAALPLLSTIDEAIRSVLERSCDPSTFHTRPASSSSTAASTQDQEWIFDESSRSSPVDASKMVETSTTKIPQSQSKIIKVEMSASQDDNNCDVNDSPLTADDRNLIRRYEQRVGTSVSARAAVSTSTTSFSGVKTTASADSFVDASTRNTVERNYDRPLKKRIKMETRNPSDNEDGDPHDHSAFSDIVELGNGNGGYDKRTEKHLKRCWMLGREELKLEVELEVLESQITSARDHLAALINQQTEVLSKRDGIRERIQQEKAKIKHNTSKSKRQTINDLV